MPIVTLDSLKSKSGGSGGGHGHAHGGHEDDEEDDGGGNEYYVGGNSAEGGSGLSVVAPGRGRGGAPPPGAGGGAGGVADAMRRAMELAQRQREGAAAGPGPGASGRRVVKVTVYSNGFVVDDGPFRPTGVPANDEFAESLAQGYCPSELVQNGQPADVQLENRQSEEYKPPPGPSVVSFSGAGATVGEIALTAGYVLVAGVEGAGQITINEKDATVRVQVRFPDNSREVLKFEKHHTVRHLINRIEAHAKGASLTRYQLLSSGRGNPKPIEPAEFDQTLTEAGLAGSVVQVREVVG